MTTMLPGNSAGVQISRPFGLQGSGHRNRFCKPHRRLLPRMLLRLALLYPSRGGLLMLRNPDAQIGVLGTRRARISTQSTTCGLLLTRHINGDDMISIDVIVSEMALFADGGLPGPSLASVEKQIGTVGTRVAVLRLLGWLKARARTNVIRPLNLKEELEWSGSLQRIVSGVDNLDNLFVVNGDSLDISDQLTEADKSELLSCVDKSYQPRLIT